MWYETLVIYSSVVCLQLNYKRSLINKCQRHIYAKQAFSHPLQYNHFIINHCVNDYDQSFIRK